MPMSGDMRQSQGSLPTRHEDARHANNRRHGRVACELLTCTVGEVLDLSASGMKVLIRGRMRTEPGAVHELSLKVLGCRLPVRARVTWSRRVGFLRHQVGFEFIDLNEQVERSLRTIASVAQKKRVLA